MPPSNELTSVPLVGLSRGASRSRWLISLPLVMGIGAYLLFLSLGQQLLVDGDTYTHIAAGQWILQHGTVPHYDPFSHSMRGHGWTAHEWLAEIMLAAAHRAGGWTGVVALPALAFAAAIALLTRALLRSLEPIYALLFAALAVSMTASHLLARPHVLAMPLLIAWTVEMVRASEEGRSPRLWFIPLMTLWANLHGGFTLGIALAFAFALEAFLAASREHRAATLRAWGLFLFLTVGASLITPYGVQGILFTWQVMAESSYALERIGEWRSPDFQTLQPLELWLLGGLALVMYQGLRLPPFRLALLLGLLHLALKHNRYVELLGLLAPLVIATPLAAQWREARKARQQLESADRFFSGLAQPAGRGAVVVGLAVLLLIPMAISRTRPYEPPAIAAPVLALAAVEKAGVKGPVLNSYGWGGYLTYAGIPPFIDGRSDVYGDAFMKQYVDAMELKTPGILQHVLQQYGITWTLLFPQSSAVALLDQTPGWRRLYADENAVVHVKTSSDDGAARKEARLPRD